MNNKRKLSYALLNVNKITERYKGSSEQYKKAMEPHVEKAENDLQEALRDVLGEMLIDMQLQQQTLIDEPEKKKSKKK